eukprot:scaffold1216_cov164-Isochrysis_galbana.AAC.1
MGAARGAGRWLVALAARYDAWAWHGASSGACGGHGTIHLHIHHESSSSSSHYLIMHRASCIVAGRCGARTSISHT